MAGLRALKTSIDANAGASAQKTRVVSSAMDPQIRDLVISTAKTVVGLDGATRRHQGVLSQVALLPEGHPYIEAMKQAGREFNEARKSFKGNNEELQKLMPAHERAWIALLTAVADDVTISSEQKKTLSDYVQNTSDPAAIRGTIISCNLKKAYKQKNWKVDHYKLELMTVPELRQVQLEAYNAVVSKPETQQKRGTPPRNPNVRAVIKTLVDLGEFTAPGEAEDKDP